MSYLWFVTIHCRHFLPEPPWQNAGLASMEVKATPRFFNVASPPGMLSSLAGQTLVAFSHATMAGGPRVFFEVRSVAQGLYTGATTMLLHKWWKERCKGWAAFATSYREDMTCFVCGT